MSLYVETLSAGLTKIDKLHRIFTIDPPVNGMSEWNIDTMPLNISQSAVYTIIPNFAFDATIKMWGAGGAGMPSTSGNPAKGGAGGYAYGRYKFEHRKPYILVVGQGGWSQVTAVQDVYLIGGGAGTNVLSGCRYGGGMSGLFSGSYTQTNAILIAGGGGAGSTYEVGPYAFGGGAGGGTNGERGHGYDVDTGQGGNNYFGYGGSQTSGGLSALTVADDGWALHGGHGSNGSGGTPAGGGGGYFGGGGSGGSITVQPGHGVAGSSGGGSGFFKAGAVLNGSLTAGVGITPGNAADSDRLGAGNAGTTSSFTSGSNGRVIIY